ncbi:MAG: hypothetical protein B7Y41_12400 [Hydrogenophilales bacterium 28-61-23]|nr:MAG: hypothetical protein B7Y41_12400 [Hydrogenophilales bacterium 28-61-23]
MQLPVLLHLPWRPPRLERGPIRLNARRLYILPTRSGLVFAMLLLGLLIGAINYGLSLAYLFTFWFAGLGVIGMLHTQRNLSGLTIRAKASPAVFAGEDARLLLEAENPAGPRRYRIGLAHPSGASRECDVPVGGKAELALVLTGCKRGWQPLGRFTLYSRHPLGLFRCWTVLELAGPDSAPHGVLIYPAPARDSLPLPAPDGADRQAKASQADGDDFTGLRGYQAGDPPRRIAWKAAARSQHLLTKQFNEPSVAPSGSRLRLDWSRTPENDTEARLSRLTRWALDAYAAGLAFELVLPSHSVNMGGGEAHLRHCLEALALYGQANGQA